MLLVYLEPLQHTQRLLLESWSRGVHYWPRSRIYCQEYDYSQIQDWWMLFSNPLYADIWLMKYSDNTRVIRTLFDE